MQGFHPSIVMMADQTHAFISYSQVTLGLQLEQKTKTTAAQANSSSSAVSAIICTASAVCNMPR